MVADSRGAHVSNEPRHGRAAKMDPSAADMALAVWNGIVQDATGRYAGTCRRHARQ